MHSVGRMTVMYSLVEATIRRERHLCEYRDLSEMLVISVIIWRVDPDDTSTPYPYRRTSTIQTGHTANIFNAQLLPHSSRM